MHAAFTFLAVSVTTYAALSLVYTMTMQNARKVGGITFLRIGRYQLSFCRCRQPAPSAAIREERKALALRSREERRLDAIASRWCNG